MKLALFGAAGRMGRSVTRLAHADDIAIVGAVEAPDSPALGRDVGDVAGVGVVGVHVSPDVTAGLLGADVVIDFSTPRAFGDMLRAARRARVPVVSGTTGLSEEDHALIARSVKRIPVLWAPNMSIGVQVLTALVRQAVRALGPEYDIEIVEAHHRAKADAPSGTARQLVAAVREARTRLSPIYGRKGTGAQRKTDELGVHAVRGGGIIGDHTVQLLGELESLEITHRAINRYVFAAGALRAARFLMAQPPGRFRLADVVATDLVDAIGAAR